MGIKEVLWRGGSDHGLCSMRFAMGLRGAKTPRKQATWEGRKKLGGALVFLSGSLAYGYSE